MPGETLVTHTAWDFSAATLDLPDALAQ